MNIFSRVFAFFSTRDNSSLDEVARLHELNLLRDKIASRNVNDIEELPKFSRDNSKLLLEHLDYSATSETSKLARHNLSVLLKLFGSISQVELANRLEVHPSNVSRLKSSGELARICFILAACDIELPSSERKLYDVKFVDSLRVLASANLKDF